MKITVLGAGAMGSAVAYDLCERPEITRVQVVEARPAVLRAFRAAYSYPRLRTHAADVRDVQTLTTIVAGSACLISCVAPEHSPALANLALGIGAHFVDLGGPDAGLADLEALSAKAEAKGRWLVPNCGLAPGLVNLLTVRAVNQFDRPRTACIRVGDVPTEPKVPFNYRLAHTAEKMLEDYTEPVLVLRDGEEQIVEPLTGLESIDFDGDIGTLEAFYAAGGLPSLVRALSDRLERIDVKTLRYPGHASQMQFLLDLGLAARDTLDVRTHLTYRDVLVRRLRQRLGGTYKDAVLVRVEVEGEIGGEQRVLTYELIDRFDEHAGLSAMRRCTAFPAAAVGVLLAKGEITGGGMASPEQIVPPDPFFEALAERGIVVTERWGEVETASA